MTFQWMIVLVLWGNKYDFYRNTSLVVKTSINLDEQKYKIGFVLTFTGFVFTLWYLKDIFPKLYFSWQM